jgi:hypothetical protein
MMRSWKHTISKPPHIAVPKVRAGSEHAGVRGGQLALQALPAVVNC